MSALPPGGLASTGDRMRSLRVAVIVDPRQPVTPPPPPPGSSLHFHLIALNDLDLTQPFLRQADVLIVEVDGGAERSAVFAQLTGEQARPVIAAGRDLTAADVRALMRAGAVDVVALPFEPREVDEALATARGVIATRPYGTTKGRIVSFIRAVGGAGATALACQTGCLWATRQSTCLIDFDVQSGAVALYLDMQPPLGLVDLVDARERLDHTLFATIAARHASGLQIIAAPREIMPLELLDPTIVAQILTIAAQSFEVVLVDLPAAWTTWSLAALAHSDATCLVTNLSVPGLRQARRQLDLIEANAVAAPVQIVLNRVPKKVFRTIDLRDSERVLRRSIDHSIANDWATMSSAIDEGKTLAAVRTKTTVEADLNVLITGLTAAMAS